MSAKKSTARNSKFPKPPASDAPIIDWALWHFDHGEATGGYWPTPLRPGEKKAYQKDWSKRPLKSRAAVERHWKKNPDDNIGLVPRPGHFWLDADDLDVLEKAEDEHGRLPRVYTQRSINGSLHFLFQGDVTTSPTVYFDGKKLGEIRGALSGQCVAAGSRGMTREGKPGTWKIEDDGSPIVAPDWVFGMIKKGGKATLKDARTDYGEPTPWDEEHARRLVEAVERGTLIKGYEGPFYEGERDNLTFQLFALGKNRMIHPDVMLEVVKGAGIDGGLEDVVERKMQSAYHDGNTHDGYGSKVPAYWLLNNPDPANRFYAVKFDRKGNRLPPPPPDDPVEWKAANPDRLPKAFPGDPERYSTDGGESDPVSDPDAERKSRFRIVRRAGMESIAPPAWLVPDFLPEDAYTMLVGGPGTFKTFIALDIALSIATGSTAGPWPEIVQAGPILFAAGEGRSQITKRVMAWEKKHLGGKQADGFTLIDPVPLISQESEWDDFIQKALRERPDGYRLVVLDTVGRAMQGLNENAQEHASNFTRLVARLRQELGTTVLALHHTGHETSTRARGSSVFGADPDTVLTLDRIGKEMQVTLNMTKQKDAPEWETPKLIKLEKIQLSLDASSLVAVKPTAADAHKAEATQSRQKSKYDPRPDPIVMDVLDKAVADILKPNRLKEWTTADLADALAMREEISVASSTLKRRTLRDLREDNSRHANRLYNPERRRWRWRD